MVSVAVVESCGEVAKCWRSSKLFTEAGGLVGGTPGPSSERRGSLIDAREADSRRSFEGLPRGGGMLKLALPVVADVVSSWGPVRTSLLRFAPSKECVEGGLLLDWAASDDFLGLVEVSEITVSKLFESSPFSKSR